MSYMMSGASRRGLGFRVNMNQVYAGADGASSSDDSGLASDIGSGLALTAKTDTFFSEGILSDIASSVQDIVGVIASGTDEASGIDQVNTQGASDQQLADKATDSSRGSTPSTREKKKQPGAGSISDILPESLRDPSRKRQSYGDSKDALDKAKAARARAGTSSEKKKAVQAQTIEDQADGVPTWVWLVAAGAIGFALYGRKK